MLRVPRQREQEKELRVPCQIGEKSALWVLRRQKARKRTGRRRLETWQQIGD